MEKRDVIMVVLGLAIVLVVAFVVKPMVTGKPVDMSIPATIPGMATPKPTNTPIATEDDSYARFKASQDKPQVTAVPTKMPTTTPSWSGQSKGLGFVDPARYSLTPTPTPIPHSGIYSQTSEFESTSMKIYATIEGKDPGSTEPIPMPFPYWELRYTVNPYESTFVGTTESKAASVASSSATEVFPSFTIQVIDADQPNRTVRTITPPGGLDAVLWKKGTDYDPRPWVEKFYEGVENHNYYFVVTPDN
ncbi:MAG: hypothetical protein WCP36_08770, partial [Methanomicrobiales archaeon]